MICRNRLSRQSLVLKLDFILSDFTHGSFWHALCVLKKSVRSCYNLFVICSEIVLKLIAVILLHKSLTTLSPQGNMNHNLKSIFLLIKYYDYFFSSLWIFCTLRPPRRRGVTSWRGLYSIPIHTSWTSNALDAIKLRQCSATHRMQ